jgi:hypothetical protein
MYKIKLDKTFEFTSQYTKGKIVDERLPSQDRSQSKISSLPSQNTTVGSASAFERIAKKKKGQKHTTAGIRWWSPTQLLICRSEACVWQSGRMPNSPQSMVVCGSISIKVRYIPEKKKLHYCTVLVVSPTEKVLVAEPPSSEIRDL